MTSMNQHLQTAQPDLIPHKEARARWQEFSAGSKRDYLTRSNKKTDKNAIPTISFTGSPARTTTLNCCTHSKETSKWRTLPRPLRTTIPSAAEASQ